MMRVLVMATVGGPTEENRALYSSLRKMMRVLGIFIACLAIGIGGFVAWYKVIYPTYTYRYRMTVEVLVDGQVKSGSSVIEVNLTKQPQWFVPLPISIKVVGEAVFVDLGEGRNVLALLASGPVGSSYPSEIVPRHFPFEAHDLRKLSGLSGTWSLSRDHLPMFVTLSDLSDPRSARVLDPNLFEEEFGAPVKLKDVVVQITRDPVTRGITTLIPWIGNYSSEVAFEQTLRTMKGGAGHLRSAGLSLNRGN